MDITNRTTTCPTCHKPISATIPSEDLICPVRRARDGDGHAVPEALTPDFGAEHPAITPARYRQMILGDWANTR